MMVPILVGPSERLRTLAESLDLDIARYNVVDAAHSQAAAEKAVELVREREAGNMLAKNLIFLSRANAAGIVLGARVRIILKVSWHGRERGVFAPWLQVC
jgi:phosphotransacetylase